MLVLPLVTAVVDRQAGPSPRAVHADADVGTVAVGGGGAEAGRARGRGCQTQGKACTRRTYVFVGRVVILTLFQKGAVFYNGCSTAPVDHDAVPV